MPYPWRLKENKNEGNIPTVVYFGHLLRKQITRLAISPSLDIIKFRRIIHFAAKFHSETANYWLTLHFMRFLLVVNHIVQSSVLDSWSFGILREFDLWILSGIAWRICIMLAHIGIKQQAAMLPGWTNELLLEIAKWRSIAICKKKSLTCY